MDPTARKLRFLSNTEEVKGYKTLDKETGQVSYTRVAKFNEHSIMERNKEGENQVDCSITLNLEDTKQNSFTSVHENDLPQTASGQAI